MLMDVEKKRRRLCFFLFCFFYRFVLFLCFYRFFLVWEGVYMNACTVIYTTKVDIFWLGGWMNEWWWWMTCSTFVIAAAAFLDDAWWCALASTSNPIQFSLSSFSNSVQAKTQHQQNTHSISRFSLVCFVPFLHFVSFLHLTLFRVFEIFHIEI